MAKITLVDSSVTIRKVVELVLSDEGFQVEAFNTGDEAMAAITKNPPVLVLADIKAKGKTGYEIAQALKADPSTANIPVLLMAGAFEPVNADLLQKSGAAGSITKPFEAKDLVGQVRSLVGGEAAPAAEEDDIVFDMSGGEDEEEAVEVMEAEPAEAVEAFDLGGEDEGVEAFDLAGEAEDEGVVELSEDEAVEAVEAVAAEEEDLWDLGETDAQAVEEVAVVEEAAPMPQQPRRQAAPQPAPKPAAPQPAAAAPQAAAPSAQAVEAALPGREEMSQIFRELAAERLDKMMATIDLKAMLIETMAPTIKESMTKILWEATPEITEKLLKEAVENSLSTLNEKLESVIWETVPELAETIIRKEIEKIQAES